MENSALAEFDCKMLIAANHAGAQTRIDLNLIGHLAIAFDTGTPPQPG
jgi:hypothetical protein